MSSVFLVDDHEIVRRGLADLLASDGSHAVVGEASTVREALARIPAVRPDVAVVDVRLPDGSGIDLVRALRDQLPDLPCLVLTSYSDDEALLDAITAGAQGYVLKQIRGPNWCRRSGPSRPAVLCSIPRAPPGSCSASAAARRRRPPRRA